MNRSVALTEIMFYVVSDIVYDIFFLVLMGNMIHTFIRPRSWQLEFGYLVWWISFL